VLETNTRVHGADQGGRHARAPDGYLPYDQILRLKQVKNVQILEQESMAASLYFTSYNGACARWTTCTSVGRCC